MGRVLCVANQKGGVGKTTTAISLAAGLARAGSCTLLIDLDPQCNATSGLGFEPSGNHPLVHGQSIRDTIKTTPVSGLEILPGCRSFADVETMSRTDTVRMTRMTQQLTQEIKGYDFVLIDCPPSLGQMTRTALAWSTEVLMPIQCEFFAMEGLVQMIEVIRDVMNQQKGRLQFGGIVLTMYDPTLELTLEVDREVRDFFGEIVFNTVIPRDVAISEAPSHGKSIIDYAPRSRGARAYTELCMEVLERV
ncbi:MAG: ParA family protein [Thermoguttaceae bacterium]|nr:ParA family protein [Thermoguttaceae bacterium]